MTNLAPILVRALNENNLHLSNAIQQKLLAYMQLMQTWNRVFNLTSITDAEEIIYLHLIDSLLIQPFIQGNSCLDVGSGAGLPGIPLALANPQQSWTLIDKNNKKTRFLTQVIAELDINNATVIKSSCEDFHPAQGFDNIISRAYASLDTFIATTEHLLNERGRLIAMKGKYPDEELASISPLFSIQQVVGVKMIGKLVERHVVIIERRTK